MRFHGSMMLVYQIWPHTLPSDSLKEHLFKESFRSRTVARKEEKSASKHNAYEKDKERYNIVPAAKSTISKPNKISEANKI